jgi:NadR type nicotinamide-nucleotide adenylyltransferase
MADVKKIVIIGPESTGKSTLCSQLADHYKTSWVPEYAREYLLRQGTNYMFDDLLIIAKQQVASEDTAIRDNRGDFLFIDTEMNVMKVWCEFVFGRCHSWILNQVANREYDMYLLCNIDLPWVADELREYPDLKSRQILYKMYKDILVNQSVPWILISGNHTGRLQTAISGIDSYFKS